MKSRIYSIFVTVAGALYFVADVALSSLGVQSQQLQPKSGKASKKKVNKKG